MNRICLIGRMGNDPEVRTVGSSVVAEFSMAVNRRVKVDGENVSDWFRIKVWGKSADYVGDYLTKGRLVSVEGRIESRKWTDKEGNQRELMEVIADNVQGLDRPKDDNNDRSGARNNDRGGSRTNDRSGSRNNDRGGSRGNDRSGSRASDPTEYDPFSDE